MSALTISLATPVKVADGGTGQTSYTDGQLLIGDSSTGGLDKATLTAGTGIAITNGHGSIMVAEKATAYASSTSSPAGTSSTTQTMSGIGLTFTPVKSGVAFICAAGEAKNTTGGDGGTLQILYGTGTAPTNGAALTGTAVGNQILGTSPTAGQIFTIGVSGVVSGLTLNTSYWFDLAQAAFLGGTFNFANMTYTVIEL